MQIIYTIYLHNLSINNHIYINVDSLCVSSSKPEVVQFAKLQLYCRALKHTHTHTYTHDFACTCKYTRIYICMRAHRLTDRRDGQPGSRLNLLPRLALRFYMQSPGTPTVHIQSTQPTARAACLLACLPAVWPRCCCSCILSCLFVEMCNAVLVYPIACRRVYFQCNSFIFRLSANNNNNNFNFNCTNYNAEKQKQKVNVSLHLQLVAPRVKESRERESDWESGRAVERQQSTLSLRDVFVG